MNLKTIALVAFLAGTSVSIADESIRFVPENYPIGVLNQGDTKHIVLQGANTTGKEIVLENVFGQGNGMSNFKFPKTIPAKGAVTIEFDLNTADMEGQIKPVVVLVDTTGKPYTANMDGIVKVFYVWETDKKARPDLTLDSESAKQFAMSTKPVMLNVDKLDQIKEGGKVPGLKVTLSTKGLSREGWELKQKSIRKIVSFKSKKYPLATVSLAKKATFN